MNKLRETQKELLVWFGPPPHCVLVHATTGGFTHCPDLHEYIGTKRQTEVNLPPRGHIQNKCGENSWAFEICLDTRWESNGKRHSSYGTKSKLSPSQHHATGHSRRSFSISEHSEHHRTKSRRITPVGEVTTNVMVSVIVTALESDLRHPEILHFVILDVA